jgi:predicted DNA-binding transcriptional regulator AlpA
MEDKMVATVSEKPVAHSRVLYALPDILARGKFSKSHLYSLIQRKHFPKPALVLGPRFTRWDSSIDDWFADPAGWIATHAQRAAEVSA